ncbi:MAG: sugar ABC transporter permease [Chloroflexaceae bacterium]|jgi:ABC-type sugar transport system permease subunit|nr:sugar ABC transporter permease [Chloroflexaceae bacterium]
MKIADRPLAVPQPARGRLARSLQRSLPLWLLLPALLILLVIQVYPSFYSIYLAFQRRQAGVESFVGLRNFEILLRSADLWESMRNTLVYTCFYLVITMVLGFGLALLLNRRVRLTPLYMVLLFIPWVLSDVVAGTIWRWMFIRDYGILQELLQPLVQRTLLADPVGAMAIVIASSVWRSLAFATLLLLAALQLVPREVQESAAIDGATPGQVFWHVTLPLIQAQVLVTVLLLSIRAINSVGLILAITAGGPVRATNTLGFFLYQEAWKFGDFGLGAAIAMIMFALNIILTIVYLRTLRAEV